VSESIEETCRAVPSSSSRPVPDRSGVAVNGRLEARLRDLVAAHLDVDPVRLEPGVRLGEDLCVDSLAAVELTMVIEDEFDISLPEEDVADVRTYGDVLALVAARAGDG
jgi:acyl carrier protein